jgi:hypothetical protein
MGCDIHLYVEATEEGGRYGEKWALIAEFDIERSYQMFGYLAGVREPELVVIPPKGLPDDLSLMLNREFPKEYHSHSWLTLDELHQIMGRMNQNNALPTDLIYIAALMQAIIDSGQQTRVVFWFDS